MDNLEEMNKFLERQSLPWWNQEEVENMNRPITTTETESVILKLHEMRVQNKMTSQVNSAKYLEKC